MKRSVLVLAGSLAALAAIAWLWSTPRGRASIAQLEDGLPNFGESQVSGARPAPPLEEMKFDGGRPPISFYAIGDTGWAGAVLEANVESMDRAAASRPVDFVLLLGDNFYPSGVESTAEPLWRERFEEPFARKTLAVPFHAVLGNHDHRGDPDAEVAYTSASTRWHMPAHWYTWTVPIREGSEAQFFALDTQPMQYGWPAAKEEEAWFTRELAASKARWKIVFGHHTVLSHGEHGGTARLAAFFRPLAERYGVDLYVSGHDHDLQVLRDEAGWLQVVSGAGSSTRDTSYGPDTLFAAASPGWVWIGIDRGEMWIEVATAALGPRFRRRVEKSPRGDRRRSGIGWERRTAAARTRRERGSCGISAESR